MPHFAEATLHNVQTHVGVHTTCVTIMCQVYTKNSHLAIQACTMTEYWITIASFAGFKL